MSSRATAARPDAGRGETGPSATAATPRTPVSSLRLVATLVATALYCVGVHLLIVDRALPSLTLLVITAPWLAAGASAIGRARGGAVAVVAGFAASAWAVWQVGAWLGARIDVPVFAENLVFLVSLAVVFASSLAGDREALVTRFARATRRGDLPPAVVRYTRRVTAGWALFFATAACVSGALFATQSRDVWSVFVNLALLPLAAAGFAIEYAIRIRLIPDARQESPLDALRAFMQRDAVVAERSER